MLLSEFSLLFSQPVLPVTTLTDFASNVVILFFSICHYFNAMGVDKRRTDGGRRTADGGRRTADGVRRTADRGAFYKHMVINVLFHPFEFLEIKFF
jgi:hypothetical protein